MDWNSPRIVREKKQTEQSNEVEDFEHINERSSKKYREQSNEHS